MNIPEETLSALYGEDYFHGQEYLDYVAEEESLRLNFANRLKTLRQLTPTGHRQIFLRSVALRLLLDQVGREVGSASGIDIPLTLCVMRRNASASQPNAAII